MQNKKKGTERRRKEEVYNSIQDEWKNRKYGEREGKEWKGGKWRFECEMDMGVGLR